MFFLELNARSFFVTFLQAFSWYIFIFKVLFLRHVLLIILSYYLRRIFVFPTGIWRNDVFFQKQSLFYLYYGENLNISRKQNYVAYDCDIIPRQFAYLHKDNKMIEAVFANIFYEIVTCSWIKIKFMLTLFFSHFLLFSFKVASIENILLQIDFKINLNHF